MNRLIAELQRLYFVPGQECRVMGREGEALRLTDALLAESLAGQARLLLQLPDVDAGVRGAVLQWTDSRDWPLVGALHQALVEELALPAQAVAVAARAGFQMWFSFEPALPPADVQDFLAALCRQYPGEFPPGRVHCHPPAGGVELPPAFDDAAQRWSAFIDPTMGSMFIDEGGLDLPPNPDRQADLLAGVKSIGSADVQRAMEKLGKSEAPPEPALSGTAAPGSGDAASGGLSLGGGFDNPHRFLLAVMNDTRAAAVHRIEAAKALLPYFAKPD